MVLEGVSSSLNDSLTGVYLNLAEQLPSWLQGLMVVALYTVIIAIYAIFIWKFYKFLAHRDIIKINLNQYNKSEHPFFNKLIASLFFFLEYVIILPALVFFWFAILAIFLLILSKSQDIGQIVLIAAAVVAATRLTSYFSQNLSQDLAKLLPFTMLAVFLLQPDFFVVGESLARFSQIPQIINQVFAYLIFILILEVVMRGLFTLVELSSHLFSGEGQTKAD